MKRKSHGLKIYASKGRVYVYHRPSHSRIYSLPETPEFFAELKTINDNFQSSRRSAARPRDREDD
jgi:hypothetical protein